MFNKYSIPITIAVAVMLLNTACTTAESQTYTAMGTVCTINLFSDGSTKRYQHIRNILNQVDVVFSANSDDSQLAKINRVAGTQNSSTIVTPELAIVVQKALTIYEQTDGAFNPAIGAIVKLWNIGFSNAAVPDTDALETALATINPANISVNVKQQTVNITTKGTKIDLGGIAKGAAADSIAAYLQSENIKQAVIDLGGNLLLFGIKKNGELWNVGIKDPAAPVGNPALALKTPSTSIVTSGIYERFFTATNGNIYHHIIDPRTGYPVVNDLLSVTVICADSTVADALSTAVFVLGLERGRTFIESRSETEAIFITADKNVYATTGIKPYITLLNTAYTIK